MRAVKSSGRTACWRKRPLDPVRKRKDRLAIWPNDPRATKQRGTGRVLARSIAHDAGIVGKQLVVGVQESDEVCVSEVQTLIPVPRHTESPAIPDVANSIVGAVEAPLGVARRTVVADEKTPVRRSLPRDTGNGTSEIVEPPIKGNRECDGAGKTGRLRRVHLQLLDAQASMGFLDRSQRHSIWYVKNGTTGSPPPQGPACYIMRISRRYHANFPAESPAKEGFSGLRANIFQQIFTRLMTQADTNLNIEECVRGGQDGRWCGPTWSGTVGRSFRLGAGRCGRAARIPQLFRWAILPRRWRNL